MIGMQPRVGRILTGGRDAKVNILDKHFAVLMCIDMADKSYGSISPGIRALSLDRMGKNLLVGTFGSEIFELNIEPSCKTVDKCRPLVRGHCSPRKAVSSATFNTCCAIGFERNVGTDDVP